MCAEPGPVVLEMAGLTKRFGAVTANDGVSLSLRRGEILALLGENGAGKTTLMNLLFGHYLPDAGEIRVGDGAGALAALPPGAPEASIAAGIGMVHQHFTLAHNLSALDNILLGTEPLFRLRRRRRAARARIEALMERSGLQVALDSLVSRLSVGERQRVEILKALYRDARILVLDEPTAVLTPQEADSLFEIMRGMAADGLSVIFISHKLREVLAFSHRIEVLRHGRNAGGMRTAEADERRIAELMVGEAVETAPPPRRAPGAAMLELEAVTVRPAGGGTGLADLSLTLHAHEILGVAGVSGNGQAALAALLSGLAAPVSGQMRLDGAPVRRFDPGRFVAEGIGRIPEDRHHHGVVGSLSLAENLVLEDLEGSEVAWHGLLRRGAIRSRAAAAIADFDIRCPGPEAPVRLLSGGNIQKLILARVFGHVPRIILANQPTRGLDLGAAEAVTRRLIEARERGAAVVLISEDLDEILTVADRVVVMQGGRLAEAPSRDRGAIGLLMGGEAA